MDARSHLLVAALLSVVPGCRAVFGMLNPTDVVDPPDAPCDDDSAAPFDVAHVDDAGLVGGTANVVWSGNIMIDTTALTVVPALPSDAAFHAMTQLGGPEVAVLELGSLHIMSVANVTGSRPLIVVARGEIRIEARLDGSADRALAGPGARASGAGVGTIGITVNYDDGGGGGGGFGTAGGDGGTATEGTNVATGGAGGSAYGDLATLLEGGAAGAGGLPMCSGSAAGGGGGGAIQLSTPGTIQLDAVITVGGGGGGGGASCANSATSGAGAGAGGAIYLQASTVVGDGRLAANGGGGGSGAHFNGTVALGTAGENGGRTSAPAAGGPPTMTDGAPGGAGGSIGPPQPGGSLTGAFPNGGGGGGAAGRIFVDVPPSASVTLASSPMYLRP